ncbi:MAG: hypothetical protein EP344_15320 [Bacteroidetes bacterium]|nr:MAG: hypothetical protein EP344_15320 [Bacteroidota bacterium]
MQKIHFVSLFVLSIAGVSGFHPEVWAQPCSLVVDIRTDQGLQNAIVYQDEFTVIGNKVFFSGAECQQSPEVYVLDAQTMEIRMAGNIQDETAPGLSWYCSVDPVWYFSRPQYLTAAKNGLLFFAGPNDEAGTELWATDGTPAGTRMVRDIIPGKESSFPKYLVPFRDGVLFSVEDPDLGIGLWYSDGTEAGTALIKTIGAGGSMFGLVANGDRIYFVQYGPGQQYWLWRSDGTAAGTLALQSLPALLTAPNVMKIANGQLYYVLYKTQGNTSSREVWTYVDSIETAVRLHTDISYFSTEITGEFTELGSKVLFAAYTADLGSELWQTDGTPTGTTLLKDLNPGMSEGDPQGFVRLGNRMLFQARDQDQRLKAWTTDGTAAGTQPLSVFEADSRIIRQGKKAYFLARGPDYPLWNLWETDGTAAGTARLGGKFKSVRNWVAIEQDWIFLFAQGNDADTYRWWRAHPASGLMEAFKPGYADNGSGVTPSLHRRLATLDDRLIFAAHDGRAVQLFRSQKDQPGATALTDFDHPYYYSEAKSLTAADGRVYFHVQVDQQQYEIWSTDGTEAYTGPVTAFQNSGLDPRWVTLEDTLQQNILFKYREGSNTHLYRFRPVADQIEYISPIVLSIYYTPFARLQDRMYFTSYHPDTGDGLWTTDGTSTGTYLVKNIQQGTSPGTISGIDTAGNLLFIRANDGLHGFEPWRSDGSEAGTYLLADINPNGNSNSGGFTAVGDRIYFIATDSTGNKNLWTTDGTPSGTSLLQNLPTTSAGAGSSYAFASFLDRLFFASGDNLHGWELWVSDGTSGGTGLFLDIYPGRFSSRPDNFILFDSLLFFTAFTPEYGRELWQTDGTVAGTKIVQDIIPGPGSSTPGGFQIQDGRLYFSVFAPDSGRELWVFRPKYAQTSTSQPPDQLNTGFRLLPNPVTAGQHLQIESPDTNLYPVRARLIDLTGRELRQWLLSGQQAPYNLDLNGTATPYGLYIIQLTGQNGNPLAMLKCVIID